MLAFHLRDLVQHVELHPVRLKQLQDTTYIITFIKTPCSSFNYRTVCWKRTVGLNSAGLIRIRVSVKADVNALHDGRICGLMLSLKGRGSYLHYGFPYFLPESLLKGDGLDPDDGHRVGLVCEGSCHLHAFTHNMNSGTWCTTWEQHKYTLYPLPLFITFTFSHLTPLHSVIHNL